MAGVKRSTFVAGAGAFAGIAIVKAPARAAQFEYKVAHAWPIGHPIAVRVVQMFDAVGKESGGRFKASIFPASTLGGDTAMTTQVRSGAIQLAILTGSPLVPACDLQGIPFAFTPQNVFRAFDGDVGTLIAQDAATRGLVTIRTVWDVGFRHVTSSLKPIHTVDDMAGLKIRVPTLPIYIATFKALGASPVTLSLGDVYTGLQTKIVDAEENSLLNVETFHLYEVQKYMSFTNHTWAGVFTFANTDAWNALPRDIQASIERNNRRFALAERQDLAALNLSLQDKLARQGVAFNTPDMSGFRPRVAPLYKQWKTQFGPTLWDAVESYTGKLA
jgi:tripartite ATP-independent transporter DctP family solute receptor